MAITGGIIRYEDGKKAGEEYAPPKKAIAEIHFSVPEGADEKPIIDEARVYAMSQVARMLDAPKLVFPNGDTRIGVDVTPTKAAAPVEQPKAEATAPAAAAAAADPAAMGDNLEVPPALKRTRRKKDEPAPEATTAAPAAQADPAAMFEEPAKPAAEPPKADEPKQDLTDNGLYKFVTALNAKFDNAAAPKITTVIRQFLPEGAPVSMKSIPEEKRAAFIAKLTEESKTWTK